MENQNEMDSIFNSVELQEVPESEMASLKTHLTKGAYPETQQLSLAKNNFEEGEDVKETEFDQRLFEEQDCLKDFRAILFPEDSKVDKGSPSASAISHPVPCGMELLESCTDIPSVSAAIEKVCREVNGNGDVSSGDNGKILDDDGSGFPCPCCNLSFTTEAYLDQHQYRLHSEEYLSLKDGSYEGDDSKGRVSSKQRTSKGSKKKEPFGPDKLKHHKCGVCEKRFTTSDHLKHHMRIHTGERPFKCTICEKTFIQAGNLHAHMRIHTNERPFKCKICGKTFNQSGNLHSHMGIHAKDKTKFQCSTCGKYFSQGGSLRNHVKIHTGEKPHKCSVCGKAFLRKNHLDTHMRIHTGEKPFICSFCNRGFSQTGDLQSHMRLHTGEAPYKCNDCGKGFTSSGHLNKHVRTHTGEKPYECSICKKAFNASSSLVTHMRMHTGERPYVCSLCGRGFYGSSNLRKHMRIHTGENLIKPVVLEPSEAMMTSESPDVQS